VFAHVHHYWLFESSRDFSQFLAICGGATLMSRYIWRHITAILREPHYFTRRYGKRVLYSLYRWGICLNDSFPKIQPNILFQEAKMSVKFNVIQRGNPAKPQDAKKFYPSIQASGRKSMRQIAGRITEISTVSTTDTMAVIEAFLTVIPQELAAGNIVELGDFGNFWLKVSAEGVAAPEEVRANQITNLLPRFNPGKEFKKVLAGIEFEKA